MHDTVCVRCLAEFRAAQNARAQQHENARRLGLLGARGSEALGTALGAVGAAGAVASRYFVSGAFAGAQSAWTGAAVATPVTPPGMQVNLRPASLPPPLQPEPASASNAPVAVEAVGAPRGRQETREADSDRMQAMEDQIRRLMNIVADQKESQTVAMR